jgi:hypothetical protein
MSEPSEPTSADTPPSPPAEAETPRPWLVPLHVAPAPPRPGERHVRLPRIGILVSDDELRRSVDRWFHKPMIVLAVLVLPLLAFEFLVLGRRPELREGILGDLLLVALAVIWLAFFVEFVIKVTIAESRIEYARRHWIDVAIIVLPLLRPLRIARVARTAKVFTLRGVGVKMARYGFALFLGVEAGDRLARRIGLRREGRRDPTRMTRHQLIQEVRRTRRQVDAWEAWFDEHRAHRETYGVDHHFDRRDRPSPEAASPEAATPDPATPEAAANDGEAAAEDRT